MIRFLLDQGLPHNAVGPMRRRGFDVVHVRDIGMHDAPDPVIVEHALQHGFVVVTLDGDFHRWIAMSGKSRPSCIRIRIEGLRAEALAALMSTILPRCEKEIVHGALVTITPWGLRIRDLPIA